MKKAIATIFLLVYFFTSSGATIQLHFCMDKLVSWGFTANGKLNCGKCGMPKEGHKGCCHDEIKIINVDKNHKASFNSFEFLKFQLSLPKNVSQNLKNTYFVHPVLFNSTNHAPPILKNIPVYISNAVFRI